MKKNSILFAFIMFSILGFSTVDFKGFEFEGSLGTSILGLNGSVAFQPKWGSKLPNNTSVEFGPKLSLNQSLVFTDPILAATSVNAGFTTEFNFLDDKPVKGYLGLELVAGVGKLYSTRSGDNFSLIFPSVASKISGGAKINNHKIGGFLSYGKGYIGVEYGYTFGR